MIKNRDIIVYGLQAWDYNIASTCKYTAIEMSKNNRVLYVNPPLQRSSALFHKNEPDVQKRLKINRGEADDLVQQSDSLWVLYPKTIIESINWIRSAALFNYFNKINDKRYAREVLKAVDRLDFKNYILFNDNSMITGYYFKEMLKPDVFVYLLRDAVIHVAYHKRHGTRLQPLIIQKADIAVTNSDYFADYARETNPNSFMIGQGVDLERFSDPDDAIQIPAEFEGVPKPIIGYVGFLTSIRLDIEALVYIAEQRPDWSLVLVGPEDEAFLNSKLHQLDNVYFWGKKDPDQLAAYIKGFDVALNPQIVNIITDINYPLKIDEYLAMGKPTVATKTTFMAYFKDHTYLPSSKEEYVVEIEKALKEDSPELRKKRMEYAGEHTWENFVKKIYDYIEIHEKRSDDRK